MNDEWETPNDLFNRINEEYHFSFDAACTTKNKKCPVGNCIDMSLDALEAPWHMASGNIWLNPPYSRNNINNFMKKAYMESLKTEHSIVCLVRDDPTARWYKEWVNDKAFEVRRLKHRVQFVGAEASYPFPCCLVVYNKDRFDENRVDNQGYNTDYYLWSWK